MVPSNRSFPHNMALNKKYAELPDLVLILNGSLLREFLANCVTLRILLQMSMKHQNLPTTILPRRSVFDLLGKSFLTIIRQEEHAHSLLPHHTKISITTKMMSLAPLVHLEFSGRASVQTKPAHILSQHGLMLVM